MDNSWVTVYSTDQLYKAELIKQILSDQQITAFVLNQQDSTYLFGNIEICVMPADVMRAKHILQNINL